jgi:streptogramin lyase
VEAHHAMSPLQLGALRRNWIAGLCLVLTVAGCAHTSDGDTAAGGAPRTSPGGTGAGLPPYVTHSIKLSPLPNFAIGAFGSLWVTLGNGTVAEVDPSKNEVIKEVRIGGKPGPIVSGFGSLWVADGDTGRLTRIDPRTGKVIARIRIPGGAYGLAVGFGSVWTSGVQWQGLAKIDPRTNKVTARHAANGNDIAVGFGSLWVTGDNDVTRLSPHDLSVESHVKTRTSVHSLGVGSGSVWASSGDGGDYVYRIDPKRVGLAATIKTDAASFPDRVAFSPGAVWVGEFQSGKVLDIDPKQNAIVRRLTAGDGSAVVTVAFGSLWVVNFYSNSVWRISLPLKG